MISASERLFSAPMFDTELGVGSPEAMEIELEYSQNISERYKRPFSILVIDLDGFSNYESNYGRKAAGLAHKLMAEHIKHSCRTVDRIFRCGVADTSLLLILPETGFEGADILSQRMVDSFAERKIPYLDSEYNVLTISASLVAYNLSDEEPLEGGWCGMLDEALLYVKVAQGQGGNRTCHKLLIADMAS